MDPNVVNEHQRIKASVLSDAEAASRGAQTQAMIHSEAERIAAEYRAARIQAENDLAREWDHRWREEYQPRIWQAQQRAAQAEAAHLQQFSFDQAKRAAAEKAAQQQQALQAARADAQRAGMSLEEFLAARFYGA